MTQRIFAQRAYKFVQMKGHIPFLRGDYNENREKTLTKLKNFLQSQWTNFNQSWHKVSLDERESSFFFKYGTFNHKQGDTFFFLSE